MSNVIVIMCLGILIGVVFHKNKKAILLVEKLTTYAIWLLLFLLGVGMGTNKAIIQNIGTLGIKAVVLSYGAILGSVLFAFFVYNFFFKRER